MGQRSPSSSSGRFYKHQSSSDQAPSSHECRRRREQRHGDTTVPTAVTSSAFLTSSSSRGSSSFSSSASLNLAYNDAVESKSGSCATTSDRPRALPQQPPVVPSPPTVLRTVPTHVSNTHHHNPHNHQPQHSQQSFSTINTSSSSLHTSLSSLSSSSMSMGNTRRQPPQRIESYERPRPGVITSAQLDNGHPRVKTTTTVHTTRRPVSYPAGKPYSSTKPHTTTSTRPHSQYYDGSSSSSDEDSMVSLPKAWRESTREHESVRDRSAGAQKQRQRQQQRQRQRSLSQSRPRTRDSTSTANNYDCNFNDDIDDDDDDAVDRYSDYGSVYGEGGGGSGSRHYHDGTTAEKHAYRAAGKGDTRGRRNGKIKPQNTASNAHSVDRNHADHHGGNGSDYNSEHGSGLSTVCHGRPRQERPPQRRNSTRTRSEDRDLGWRQQQHSQQDAQRKHYSSKRDFTNASNANEKYHNHFDDLHDDIPVRNLNSASTSRHRPFNHLHRNRSASRTSARSTASSRARRTSELIFLGCAAAALYMFSGTSELKRSSSHSRSRSRSRNRDCSTSSRQSRYSDAAARYNDAYERVCRARDHSRAARLDRKIQLQQEQCLRDRQRFGQPRPSSYAGSFPITPTVPLQRLNSEQRMKRRRRRLVRVMQRVGVLPRDWSSSSSGSCSSAGFSTCDINSATRASEQLVASDLDDAYDSDIYDYDYDDEKNDDEKKKDTGLWGYKESSHSRKQRDSWTPTPSGTPPSYNAPYQSGVVRDRVHENKRESFSRRKYAPEPPVVTDDDEDDDEKGCWSGRGRGRRRTKRGVPVYAPEVVHDDYAGAPPSGPTSGYTYTAQPVTHPYAPPVPAPLFGERYNNYDHKRRRGGDDDDEDEDEDDDMKVNIRLDDGQPPAVGSIEGGILRPPRTNEERRSASRQRSKERTKSRSRSKSRAIFSDEHGRNRQRNSSSSSGSGSSSSSSSSIREDDCSVVSDSEASGRRMGERRGRRSSSSSTSKRKSVRFVSPP